MLAMMSVVIRMTIILFGGNMKMETNLNPKKQDDPYFKRMYARDYEDAERRRQEKEFLHDDWAFRICRKCGLGRDPETRANCDGCKERA